VITVITHAVASLDGFIADPHDEVGPLFDWYFNGDVKLGDDGPFMLSKASFDYVRPMWDSIRATVMGRHLFDLTNGWEGKPPAGEHLVVVSHRPKPAGWHPEAPCHFADNVPDAIAKATELAGDGTVAVTAGDVGGQAIALGLIDEVAIDVVPVVFGAGKRYFGPIDAQQMLEDPHVVIQGDRVVHFRYRVRR
jgi:dihydrofolate reductase